MNPETVDAAILAVCAGEKSVSPSDVAEALMPGGHWQSLLPVVKKRAVALMLEGRIEILRKGRPVTDPEDVRGVIRLRAKT
ncbi:MAG: DUF3253 domain-containing protein [Rhodospirillales bacterium]|nr:DUF3253 domain-containing protein [Rhodospirillales bacterium]